MKTRWLATLGVLAILMASGSPAHAAMRGRHQPSVGAVERAIRGCVNRQRVRHGLPRLKDNRSLDRAARYHARNMLRHGFFEHADPWGRGPEERVALFDRRPRSVLYIGENIAAGYASARAACQGWMASAGHRANILDRDYTAMGAGFARGRRGYGTYYVQDFGIQQSQAKPGPGPGPEPAGSGGGSANGGSGGPTTQHVVVHLFNIDDSETLYLNGTEVASAGYGESLDVDLGELTTGDRITVEVSNLSAGYSWGISEDSDGTTVLNDEDGSAGQYGANGDDQTTGVVHRLTFDSSGDVLDSYTAGP